jgi:hypothetical protein
VKNLTITNSYFETVAGVNANFAEGIILDKVKFDIKNDNLFTLNQTKSITLNNVSFSGNIKSFISLKGEKTDLIKISGTDLSKLTAPVIFSPEVNKNSIEIK